MEFFLKKMKYFDFQTSVIKSESYTSYRKVLVYIDCFLEAKTFKYGTLKGSWTAPFPFISK